MDENQSESHSVSASSSPQDGDSKHKVQATTTVPRNLVISHPAVYLKDNLRLHPTADVASHVLCENGDTVLGPITRTKNY